MMLTGMVSMVAMARRKLLFVERKKKGDVLSTSVELGDFQLRLLVDY